MEAVERLLELGCNTKVTEDNDSPLHEAIASKELEVAKYFIDNNYFTDFVDSQGRDNIAIARLFGCDYLEDYLGGNSSRPTVWLSSDIKGYMGKSFSQSHVNSINSTLGITIPEFLADFLIEHFPDELFFSDAPDDDSWVWLGKDSLLFHTVRSYVAYNTEDCRKPDLELLFDDYIVIGENHGGGDYWAVRLDGSSQNVFYYDHEGDKFSDTGKGLVDHCKHLVADRAE